jgi:ankyrin repeat domain-containing protein 50
LSHPIFSLDYTTQDAILPKIQELYPVPHAILAHVCIAHLVSCGLQNYEPEARTWSRNHRFNCLCKRDNLLLYAYSSWIAHTLQCGRYSPVVNAVTDLVLNSTSFPLHRRPFPYFGGPLHIAVVYGLQDLILPAARLQSPNAHTTNGESPLFLAIERDRLACAQTLLSVPDIDLNAWTPWGFSPLMYAIARGNLQFVQLLVEASGININAGNRDGETPLMWAAMQSGPTEAVKLLLGLPGIEVNAKDVNGWTALIHATYRGRTKVVQQLLKARDIHVNTAIPGSLGFGRDGVGSTALMIASQMGNIDIVKYLLEAPGIDLC